MTYGESRLLAALSDDNTGADKLYDVTIRATFRVTGFDLDDVFDQARHIGFVSTGRDGRRTHGRYMMPVTRTVKARPTNTSPYPVRLDDPDAPGDTVEYVFGQEH